MLRQDVRELQIDLDALRVTNSSTSKAKEMNEFELRRLKAELHETHENLEEVRSVAAQLERTKVALKKAESSINTLTQKLNSVEEDKNELVRQFEIAEGKLRSSR